METRPRWPFPDEKPAAARARRRKVPEREPKLDHAIEETFPASDPPAATPRRKRRPS